MTTAGSVTNISALTTAVVSPSASPPDSPKPVGTIASAIALVEEEMRAVEVRLRERLESPVGAIPEIGAQPKDICASALEGARF